MDGRKKGLETPAVAGDVIPPTKLLTEPFLENCYRDLCHGTGTQKMDSSGCQEHISGRLTKRKTHLLPELYFRLVWL